MNSLVFTILFSLEGLMLVACRPGISCLDEDSGSSHMMDEVFVKKMDVDMSEAGPCVVCHCAIYAEGTGYMCQETLEPVTDIGQYSFESLCYVPFYDIYVHPGTMTSRWDPLTGRCMLCTCVVDLFTNTPYLRCLHESKAPIQAPLGLPQQAFADDLIAPGEVDLTVIDLEAGAGGDGEKDGADFPIDENNGDTTVPVEEDEDETNNDKGDKPGGDSTTNSKEMSRGSAEGEEGMGEGSGSLGDGSWSSGEEWSSGEDWSSGVSSGELISPVYGMYSRWSDSSSGETSGDLDENYEGSGEVPTSEKYEGIKDTSDEQTEYKTEDDKDEQGEERQDKKDVEDVDDEESKKIENDDVDDKPSSEDKTDEEGTESEELQKKED